MGVSSYPKQISKAATVTRERLTDIVSSPTQVGTGNVQLESIKAFNNYECAGLYLQAHAGAAAPATGDTSVTEWVLQAGATGVNSQNESSMLIDDTESQCLVNGGWLVISETPNVYTPAGTALDNGVNNAIPAAPVDANVSVEVAYVSC